MVELRWTNARAQEDAVTLLDALGLEPAQGREIDEGTAA